MHRIVRFRSAIAINNKNRDNNNNNNETDGRPCEEGGLSADRQIVGVSFVVVTPELRNWRNDLTTRRVRGESVLKLSISIALSLDLYCPSFLLLSLLSLFSSVPELRAFPSIHQVILLSARNISLPSPNRAGQPTDFLFQRRTHTNGSDFFFFFFFFFLTNLGFLREEN
jgi:hypothetical protein